MSQPSGSAAPANPPPASNGGHALLAVNPPPSNPTGNNGGQPLFAPNSPPNPRESPPPEPHTPLPVTLEFVSGALQRASPGDCVAWPTRKSRHLDRPAHPRHGGRLFRERGCVRASIRARARCLFCGADASVPEREVSAPASAPERDVFSASANVSVPERDVSPASALECPRAQERAKTTRFRRVGVVGPRHSSAPTSYPGSSPPAPAYADPPSPPPVYNPDPFNLAAITPGSRRNANIPLVTYASNPDSPQSPDRPRSLSPPHSRYLARSNHRLAMAFYSPFGNDCDGAIFKGDFGTRDEESEEEWRMQEEEDGGVEQELEREELENQVGGGRRQATPPIITRTYLRPVIRRTPNAGPEVEGLFERRSLPPSDDDLSQPSSPRSPPDFLAAVEVKPDETGGSSDGADASAKSKGGRPTKEQLAAVGACHSEMDRLVENNPWNIYQKYARAIENREEEWARLNTAKHHFTTFTRDPDGHPPPLEGKNLKKAWTEFQAAYPDKQAADQLRDWREMDRLCTEVTVGARRRHFHGAGGKVAQILKTLSKRHNFQSLLIFTGSYANEDQQLAMFQSTGGLAQIFTDLRPNLPVLDQHDILGIAKNIAAREEIKFTLLGGDEDDQEADASAASRAAVADASASRAQNKNATQALLQSAQNVLNQFQTQGVKFTENDLSRRQLRQVEERDATHALQTRLSGAAQTLGMTSSM
ncbi:hypothetical protein B0H14DRAFT_2646526 [Mycena olivaceomarginata]|nr:hypothetical protein B0H14DRAFT_2646526 [Mycena olivaceomarginata]